MALSISSYCMLLIKFFYPSAHIAPRFIRGRHGFCPHRACFRRISRLGLDSRGVLRLPSARDLRILEILGLPSARDSGILEILGLPSARDPGGRENFDSSWQYDENNFSKYSENDWPFWKYFCILFWLDVENYVSKYSENDCHFENIFLHYFE
jgi:hypothetical protein